MSHCRSGKGRSIVWSHETSPCTTDTEYKFPSSWFSGTANRCLCEVKCFFGPWSNAVTKAFRLAFSPTDLPSFCLGVGGSEGVCSLSENSLSEIQSQALHREAEYQNYENPWTTFIKLVSRSNDLFPFNAGDHLTYNFTRILSYVIFFKLPIKAN